jgi:hypothetical protein
MTPVAHDACMHPSARLRPLAALVIALLAFAACADDTQPTEEAVAFECIGVPGHMCEEMLRDAQQPGGPGIVGMRIRCVSTCSEVSGEVEVVTLYSDGTRSESGAGWSAPAPMPPEPIAGPPVDPTCLGLARQMCLDMATSAADGIDPATVGAITVRCVGTCTPMRGEGETVVTFRDGGTRESSWSYESSGGG